MSGWANHIEPIKGTRRRICRMWRRQCQHQRRRNACRALTRNTCARSVCPMNITLSIDDRVVAKARQIASVRGTSLNQLVRDYLEDYDFG